MTVPFTSNRSSLCIIFFLLTVATRLPFSSKYLYHLDSVNFALALERFDPAGHQPHPPGYFLYVMLGRLLHLVVSDANAVYVTLGMIFSGLTVATIYLLVEEMSGRRIGCLAACFAITSPNLWFHGEVALSYVTDAFFSALIGLLCWRLGKGRENYLWPAAICLGIAGGFRQSTVVFLFPLMLFAGRKAPPGKMLAALALLAATCSAWFVLMIRMAGGWETYHAALVELWEFSTGHNSVFERGGDMLSLYARTLFLFTVYSMGTGILAVGLAAYARVRHGGVRLDDVQAEVFHGVWMLPALFFHLLIFIHPQNPGYAMIFTPPLMALSARATAYVGQCLKEAAGRDLTTTLSLVFLPLNAAAFLFTDSQVSWHNIRNQDRNVACTVKEVGRLDPLTSVILVKPYVFNGFRHVMYYLPQHRVYQMDLSTSRSGQRRKIFWGTGRRTFLSDEIRLTPDTSSVAVVLDSYDGRLASDTAVRVRSLYPHRWLASGSVNRMRQVYHPVQFAAVEIAGSSRTGNEGKGRGE